jgi:hypothetical protein
VSTAVRAIERRPTIARGRKASFARIADEVEFGRTIATSKGSRAPRMPNASIIVRGLGTHSTSQSDSNAPVNARGMASVTRHPEAGAASARMAGVAITQSPSQDGIMTSVRKIPVEARRASPFMAAA